MIVMAASAFGGDTSDIKDPADACALAYDIPMVPVGSFDWDNSDKAYLEDLAWHNPAFLITVDGDEDQATWTASSEVGIVIHRESEEYLASAGGTSGTVDSEEHKIKSVTFCVQDSPSVPEFGLGAGLVAILVSITAFVMIRKK